MLFAASLLCLVLSGALHAEAPPAVLEKTPLAKWIRRGKDRKFALRRLKARARILTPQTLARMKKIAAGYLGKEYDLHFAWDDERLYCSELVWKIYQRGAGLEVGKLQKPGDFDLNDKLVKSQLREQHGSRVPLNENVISPAAMLSSERLFEPAF
ncbi:MAG: hypothetical protein LBU11_02315 [Zoogloeaceae bacterium]|jgi:hypothetical protein|nr:hypothetical protein [Zoogloeaceae bacterium]